MSRHRRRQQLLASVLQPAAPGSLYIPGNEGCADITPDYRAHVKGKFAGGTTTEPGRITSSIVAGRPRDR